MKRCADCGHGPQEHDAADPCGGVWVDEEPYYDRQGRPIDLMAMIARKEAGEWRVARDELDDGRVVSTVWLGLDHQVACGGTGAPVIFETMVFHGPGNFDDLHCERWCTEAEALEGHSRIVRECEEGKHTREQR